MRSAITVAAALAAGCAAGWAQQQISPIALKAKADFDKVDSEPNPAIPDALACVQSSAAALTIARVDERYLVFYRKGYCELFTGVLTADAASFQNAARDFMEVSANWPKKATTRPPVGLRALIAIAHVEQGRTADSYPDLERDLTAVTAESCAPSPLMAKAFCEGLLDTARTWQAWLSYRKGDFDGAARLLEPLMQPTPRSLWGMWISGRLAQQKNHIAEAATLYEKTLTAWSAAEKSPNPDVVTLLGPKFDAATIQYQLGLLDYSAQKYDSAINHLDAAIKGAPSNAFAIFLRARSKDALHLNIAAMEDYSLATRTARANNDSSWNVGQASYYRGLLLYQAKDYTRAEGEFSGALSGRMGDIGQPDVTAWKTMAAVAGGNCKSTGLLESAVKAASNQFPKAQAEGLIFDCRRKEATTLEQYIALEKTYGSKLDVAKLAELRGLIANMYADQGVVAEDKKDPHAAVLAYRHALEWNPDNPKARFNLGAIYIDDKRYDLAETEYRALVKADGEDHEAQYWLAESILAQRPGPDRIDEACSLLQRSVTIADAEKKAEFSKALTAAKCP